MQDTASQILSYTWKIWAFCKSADSDSIGLGWNPRFYISHKLSGDANDNANDTL